MIDDGIGVFPQVFSESFCDAAIRLYEVRKTIAGDNLIRRTSATVTDESVVFGSERSLDCFDSVPVDTDFAPSMIQELNSVFWEHCYKPYADHYSLLRSIATHRFGTVKIQHTRPKEGYHKWHCEHGDIATSRRLAFFILYLNDVEEGGETEFLHQGKRIKPTKGTVVIAPASFTHAHRGNPPLSNDKIVITSWIEFVE